MSRPPASARPPAASPPRDQKAECRHCGPRKLTTTSSSSSSPSVEEGRGGRQNGANRPPRKKGGFLNGARRVRGQPALACLLGECGLFCPPGISPCCGVCTGSLDCLISSSIYPTSRRSLTRQKHFEFHFKLNFHLSPISSQ